MLKKIKNVIIRPRDRGGRVKLFRLKQVIFKSETQEILATRVTDGSQRKKTRTGGCPIRYLMAGQITFTGKSKHKILRTGLLFIHNGFRFIIRRFRKVLDTFICVLSTKVCFVLTVSTCCTVHMFIFGFGCNNFLFAGKGSGRKTSILAGRVTGRLEIYPKPGL